MVVFLKLIILAVAKFLFAIAPRWVDRQPAVERWRLWLSGWERIPETTEKQLWALVESPNRLLQQEAIPIGPFRQPWRMIAVLTIMTAGLGWYAAVQSGQSRVVWAFGGFLFGFVLSWTISREYALRMILDSSGVRIVKNRVEVICPWSLFAADGVVARTESAARRLFLRLPVNFQGVPGVLLQRDGKLEATGYDVQTDFFRFVDDSAVEILAGFEVGPELVAAILLKVSRELEG